MNKEKVIKAIAEKLNCSVDKATKINNIVEEVFIIGKKNKDKILAKFSSELKINEEEANKIYEAVMSVIGSGIKDKLLHPFKDLDRIFSLVDKHSNINR